MHTRIICIDSEVSHAERPIEVLRASGYEVMLASSREVGLALIRLFPPDIVLLDFQLADQLMPEIQRSCPSAHVVLTGDAPLSMEEIQSNLSAGAA